MPELVLIEAILMPNDEIIHQGKTIGYFLGKSENYEEYSSSVKAEVAIIRKTK